MSEGAFFLIHPLNFSVTLITSIPHQSVIQSHARSAATIFFFQTAHDVLRGSGAEWLNQHNHFGGVGTEAAVAILQAQKLKENRGLVMLLKVLGGVPGVYGSTPGGDGGDFWLKRERDNIRLKGERGSCWSNGRSL
jgi:hypothetical protein